MELLAAEDAVTLLGSRSESLADSCNNVTTRRSPRSLREEEHRSHVRCDSRAAEIVLLQRWDDLQRWDEAVDHDTDSQRPRQSRRSAGAASPGFYPGNPLRASHCEGMFDAGIW